MKSIHELAELRELILKNAILNRLLVETLLKKTQFPVASVLKNLYAETKKALLEDTKRQKKLPTYALYDIIIQLGPLGFQIGIKYSDHEIIWEYSSCEVTTLKELANFIYSKYSVNPAKLDKVFSSTSLDIKAFLNSNAYSDNFWRLGFSKKCPKTKNTIYKETIVDDYFNILLGRLNEYRSLNTILISILKNNSYAYSNDFGELIVKKTVYPSKLLFQFTSRLDFDKTYSDVLPISFCTPSLWNLCTSDIDLGVLIELT